MFQFLHHTEEEIQAFYQQALKRAEAILLQTHLNNILQPGTLAQELEVWSARLMELEKDFAETLAFVHGLKPLVEAAVKAVETTPAA